MKITATFDNEQDAVNAIQANHAWDALMNINEVLRQNRKYGLPYEQAVLEIQEYVDDSLKRISLD